MANIYSPSPDVPKLWSFDKEDGSLVASQYESVKQSLHLLLETEKGSRIYLPTYGISSSMLKGLPSSLYLPKLKKEVIETISVHLPMVKIVSLTAEGTELGKITYTLTWQVVGYSQIETDNFTISTSV